MSRQASPAVRQAEPPPVALRRKRDIEAHPKSAGGDVNAWLGRPPRLGWAQADGRVGGEPKSVSRRRLLAIYLVLLAVVVVGASLSIAAGEEQDAQPAIAGGYDVERGEPLLGRCLRPLQSGQFVNIKAADRRAERQAAPARANP